jgi:hypothetical protein
LWAGGSAGWGHRARHPSRACTRVHAPARARGPHRGHFRRRPFAFSRRQRYDPGVEPDRVPVPLEDIALRTPEWVELEHRGSGTPGILKVEYDLVTEDIRVSGPVVVDNPPHAPAP